MLFIGIISIPRNYIYKTQARERFFLSPLNAPLERESYFP